MNDKICDPGKEPKQEQVTAAPPYTPPAITYSGQITTRAGSPTSADPNSGGIDPSDLFKE
jgi:hypothetical protein